MDMVMASNSSAGAGMTTILVGEGAEDSTIRVEVGGDEVI